MSTTSFRELGLDDVIIEAIESSGYEFATPVQAEGIPAFLSGEDLILQAQTGTGKTAAFALPILQLLEANPGTVEALVLAPTRELASQIAREFGRAGAACGISACAIYGGAPFDPQIEALQRSQVVCATPGRLLDHLRRGTIDLSRIRIFGLDEADEMLSMGFEKDVFDIISHLPAERQSFLCSATLNEPILRLASNFLDDDARTINLSSDSVGAQSIEHARFDVSQQEKLAALRRILTAYCSDGGLIFANTRAATFRVTASLQAEGFEVDVLNGDLPQKEREKALKRMRSGEVQYLVATDVAARGIDISGLPSVVNYDMPDSPDIYVHRTGRTGRAGQFGIAYSLVTPGDVSVHHYLTKFYKLRLRPRPLPNAEDVLAIRADQAIASLLGDLDADGRLSYGDFLPAAQRLREREDGARTVAKLIASFRDALQAIGRGEAQLASADLPDEDLVADAPYEAPVEEAPVPEVTTEAASLDVEAEAVEAFDDAADDSDATQFEATPEVKKKSSRARAPRPSRTPEASIEEAMPSGDEEAPAAKRSRRPRRSTRTDAPSEEETVRAPAPAPARAPKVSAEAAKLHDWILDNSGSRGRAHVRSLHAISSALGLDKDEVLALAEAHPNLEITGRSRPMVRVRESGDAEPAADSERSTPAAPERPSRPARERAPRTPKESNSRTQNRPPAKAAARPPAARPPAPRRTTGRKDAVTIFDEPSGFVSVQIGGAGEIGDLEAFAETLAIVAGLEREDLGKVRAGRDGCTIDVRDLYLEDFVRAINGAPVAGRSLSARRAR